MDRLLFVVCIFGLFILEATYFLTPIDAGREMSIPPTNAFDKINILGTIIYSDKYNDVFYVKNGTGINLVAYPLNNTINISSPSGSSPVLSMEQLSNVTDVGCGNGQARVVNATGWYVCSNIGMGDITGAANVGTGQGSVYRDETAGIINLKTLKEGANISIINDANDVTISVSGSTPDPNIGKKRWGSFVPSSTTALGDGQLGTSFILDGTETFIYDSTSGANFAAISSACGTTASGNCGGVQTATNLDVFRRDQDAYLYVEWRQNEITTERVFIGFRSGTTPLPNAADTIVNGLNGFGVCIRSTDILYQRCENDATGAGTYTSLGVTQDTNGHYAEIYADNANNRWCVKIDGGAASCATTDIPAATSRMWINVEAETVDTSNTTFIYGTIHVRNNK